MTGEQKTGGLENWLALVMCNVNRVYGDGLRPILSLDEVDHATSWREEARDVLAGKSPLSANTPVEPAEARIREAERKAELYDHMKDVAEANGFKSLTEAIARATAAEAKLAKAKEALEKTRDHFDFLVRMASGSAVFEIVDGKRLRRKLGEAIASEADEGSKFARQTLAALQEAEGKA